MSTVLHAHPESGPALGITDSGKTRRVLSEAGMRGRWWRFALILAITVIVLVPIVYAFAKIANVHPIKFGLPMAGIMLSIHVAVPPHPGIVAGAGVFGADIGLITMISLIICIPLGFLSYWVASIMNRKDYELLPGVKQQVEEFGSESLVHVGHDGPGARAIAPPRPGLIMFLIAAPIVQILLGTVGTLTIPKDNYWYGVASFIGNPFFALLVAVALSFFLLAVRRNWSLKETGEIFEGALPPIASSSLRISRWTRSSLCRGTTMKCGCWDCNLLVISGGGNHFSCSDPRLVLS